MKLLRSGHLITIIILSSIVLLAAGDKVAAQPETGAHQPDEKNLKLKMKKVDYYKDTAGRMVIEIEGETNLPDEAIIWTYIRRRSHLILGSSTKVENGRYAQQLGPFREQIDPGIYSVESAFIPRTQELKVLAQINQSWTDEEKNTAKQLQIGTDEEIKIFQEGVVKELRTKVDEVSELSKELEDMYLEQKTKFNRVEWNTWAGDWLNKLEDIRRYLDNRNQGKIISLYPKAEDDLGGVITNLMLLQSLYTRLLTGKKDTGPFSPKKTKSSIASNLASIKSSLHIDYEVLDDKFQDDWWTGEY